MHDVEVVAGLLQQQGVGAGAVGVPVLEVVVAAVADEVAHPDRLDLADLAAVDDLLHEPHDAGVAEVVSDVEHAVRLGGGGQHAVGVGEGRREGLLQVDGDAVRQQVDGDVGVGVVGRGDDGRIDGLGRDEGGHVVVDGDAGQERLGALPPLRTGVDGGHHAGAGVGDGHVTGDHAARADPDHGHADLAIRRTLGRNRHEPSTSLCVHPIMQHVSDFVTIRSKSSMIKH